MIQQLAAKQPAIAVIDPVARGDVLQEAVASHVDAVDPRRDRVGDRTGDTAVDAAKVVIADGRFAISFSGELRLGGDDVNQARRGVAAEQGALRPAQHLDPIDRPKLGQAGADAAAINTVDKHGDGAFQPGVVADRADAANSSAAGARFGRGRRNEQGRADLVETAKIDRAGIPDGVPGHRRHGKRNVAQRFGTAGGGDDDGAFVIGFSGLRRGIDIGGFCRRLGRGGPLVGRRLSKGRPRKSNQTSRKQPHRFAHDILPISAAPCARRLSVSWGS